ncbi:glycosyltransferase family 2 protein [Gaetbulibacter aestuarii]|uniref:Glycosyltransferase family 2 protein n=1 Tax=Gaetbulibacter aestuarii TaxID=1502358 RepID=A0ABW7MYX9_9FLAO
MIKKPFFSVIISVFNKQQYIEKTIWSVINQSFDDFEIIIVNDGSTDNSLELIEKFEDPRISHFTIKNQGPSHARNYGIKKARAEFVALLDGDDLWHPMHLYTIFQLIKKFPNAGAYSSGYNIQVFGKHIKKTKLNGIPENYIGLVKNYFDHNLYDSVINSSVAVIPKFVFDDIGFFNETVKSGEDTLLWIKIALKYPFAINTIVTATIIKNNQGLSQSNHYKDRLLIFDTFKKEEKVNKSLKKYLDLNRFALVLLMKRNNEIKSAKTLISEMNMKNLNKKQKLILHLSPKFLRSLYTLKQFLEEKRLFLYLYR